MLYMCVFVVFFFIASDRRNITWFYKGSSFNYFMCFVFIVISSWALTFFMDFFLLPHRLDFHLWFLIYTMQLLLFFNNIHFILIRRWKCVEIEKNNNNKTHLFLFYKLCFMFKRIFAGEFRIRFMFRSNHSEIGTAILIWSV